MKDPVKGIWIVMGATGTWKDRQSWLVCACLSKRAALSVTARLKADVKRFLSEARAAGADDTDARDIARRRMCRHDPLCVIDRTGVRYGISRIPFMSPKEW